MMLPNTFKAEYIALGYTQLSLADKLGISPRTIRKWCNETTIPTIAVYALEGIKSSHKANNSWWYTIDMTGINGTDTYCLYCTEQDAYKYAAEQMIEGYLSSVVTKSSNQGKAVFIKTTS